MAFEQLKAQQAEVWGAASWEQAAPDLALVRHALGEAAYDAAVGRGAAMDDDEVVGYAVGEFRRVAGLLAKPGVQAPDTPRGLAEGYGRPRPASP
jgi:hypothetical protein